MAPEKPDDEWTFDDFKADLDELQPEVRAKALEIAKELMKNPGYDQKKAITEAIDRAEEWYLNAAG